MNYYKVFYWLTVADNAKFFFHFFSIVFAIIAIVATISYFLSEKVEDKNKWRKWIWWSYPLLILFWAGVIFTPSKKDSLLILAGGGTMNFLTTDSASKELPHELVSFVVTELKSMATDAKVEIITNQYKESVIEQAKNMTQAERIEAMKDSAFASVILNELYK